MADIFITQDKREIGVRKGFTLIELMLVVVIIAVLVSMVMPRLAGRSQQTRLIAAETDIEANIALTLDLFNLDVGRYPTTEEGLSSLLEYSGKDVERWKGPYIKKVPKDPWGKDYIYKFPGTHNNDYDLYSAGPNGVEGDDDDIKNWE